MQEDAQSEPARERRFFLHCLSSVLLSIPILGPLLVAARVLKEPSPRSGAQSIETLPLSEIPTDRPKVHILEFTRVVGVFRERVQQVVFLRRIGEEVLALSSECTHLGCLVHFEEGSEGTPAHFACPCHKGQFDLLGKRTKGPPPAPLRRLVTEVPKAPESPVRVEVL